MSLDSAASGTDLCTATHIVMIDPVSTPLPSLLFSDRDQCGVRVAATGFARVGIGLWDH